MNISNLCSSIGDTRDNLGDIVRLSPSSGLRETVGDMELCRRGPVPTSRGTMCQTRAPTRYFDASCCRPPCCGDGLSVVTCTGDNPAGQFLTSPGEWQAFPREAGDDAKEDIYLP